MPESRKRDFETHEIQRVLSDQESMWDGFKYGKPGVYAEYFNDFYTYLASDWTITTTEGGAGSATEALTDEVGGVLLITNAAGDDDLDSLQLGAESFLPAAGKKIYYETRFKVSDTGDSEYLHGLVVTDTTPLAHANGITFRSDDDDDLLDFRSSVASANDDDSAIHTMADGVYVKVGFRVNGLDSIDYFVNDVKKGSVNSVPSTEMRPTLHLQNGSASARNMSIDYIFCAQER